MTDGPVTAPKAGKPGWPAEAGAAVVADSQGRIRRWDSACEVMFGYSAEEAIGQSLDLIVPGTLRPLHWRGFARAFRAGELKRPGALLRVPARHKDGSIVPVRFIGGTLLQDENGRADSIRLLVEGRDPSWMVPLYRILLAVLETAQRAWRLLAGVKATRA